MNIPEDLKKIPNWISWKAKQVINSNGETKTTKVPVRIVDGANASSTNPADWVDFETAYRILGDNGNYGFVFTKEAGIAGIDLDHVKNNPQRESLAKKIIERFSSYTEISPSGNGYHIYIKANKDFDGNKGSEEIFGKDIETYDEGRFFTVTGDGDLKPVEERQDLYSNFGKVFFKEEQKEGVKVVKATMEDQKILELAFKAKNGQKIKDLYDGITATDYQSGSEADQALMNYFSFYTQDPEQLKRIMWSSQLVRDKWQRPDYLDRSVASALKVLNEKYTPGIDFDARDWTPPAEEMFFKITPFNEISQHYTEEDWILEDIFCKGGLFNFSAYNKTGKTAFLMALFNAMTKGDEFIGRKINRETKTLFVSEEYERTWIKKKIDLKEAQVDVAMNPFPKSNNLKEWKERIEILRQVCVDKHYDMIVIDTIDQFWGVTDENDSTDTSQNVESLRALTNEGVCVVQVLHTRKNGGFVGKNTRGSGAINDKVDGIISFDRFDEENVLDNKRVLTIGNGRFYDEPSMEVLDFNTETKQYIKVADSIHEVKRVKDEEKLLEFIGYGRINAKTVAALKKEMDQSPETAFSANTIKILVDSLRNKQLIKAEKEKNTFVYYKTGFDVN